MKKAVISFILLLSFGLFSTNDCLAFEGKTETSFEFLVKPSVETNKLLFNIVLKNTGKKTITFQFPTSQKYEIKIINSAGKEVYVYSADRSFLQAINTIVLKPNDEKRWTESWDYIADGRRVQKGEYKLVAQLLANKRNDFNVLPFNYEASIFVPETDTVFQNIFVTGNKGKYKVSGEARPITGEFYYSVEDGHNEYISETKVETSSKHPEWSPFQINLSIAKNKLPKNASLILSLYEKIEGVMVHSNPVLLERF